MGNGLGRGRNDRGQGATRNHTLHHLPRNVAKPLVHGVREYGALVTGGRFLTHAPYALSASPNRHAITLALQLTTALCIT